MRSMTLFGTDGFNSPVRSFKKTRVILIGLVFLLALLTACDTVTPPTPTQIMSGPTLEASPTTHILTSEQLYGTSVAFGGDGRNNATTAPIPSRGSLPPIIRATAVGAAAARIDIFLEDGTTVSGDLYTAADALVRGPALMLIGPEKAVWGDVPQQMRTAGLTVLVVPLRVTPAATDLRSLLTSISELPTVDPSHIGMIVQGSITDVMFTQCAHEGFCLFAALIGPQDRDTLLTALSAYQPRLLFLATGDDNSASTTAAIALVSAAPQATVHRIARPTLSDSALQSDSALVTDLVAWVSAMLVTAPEMLPTIERQ